MKNQPVDSRSGISQVLKAVSDSLKKKDIELISLGDPEVGTVVKQRIPTSSRFLNHILGGGIPCGRLTEIYGEEGNGKSSLAADIMAHTQKMGGIAVIIDSEGVFDPGRAAAMGVDTNNVIYTNACTVEQAFEVMEQVLEELKDSEDTVTIIWDSVAASPTKAEFEGEIGEQAMAAKARILSKGMRKIGSKLWSKVALIFLNQVRTKMGIQFGKPTEAAGGFAIRYAASVRIELMLAGSVKVQDRPIGIKCRAYTKKNKTFKPSMNAEFEMYFAGGIDDSNAILDLLVEQETIGQSGSWYVYQETKFMRKDFKKHLEAGLIPEEIITEALEKI